MVIIVLLNDEFTCATPETIFLRSRRRTRVVASFAIALGPSSAPVIPGARASWFKRQNHTHPRPVRAAGTRVRSGFYFFLPAIGFALPLRVRALVWVR